MGVVPLISTFPEALLASVKQAWRAGSCLIRDLLSDACNLCLAQACQHSMLPLTTRGAGAGVQRSGRLSKLHEEVSRVLWSMGVLHRNEHIVCGGMFCVHVALEGDKVTRLAGCCCRSLHVKHSHDTAF